MPGISVSLPRCHLQDTTSKTVVEKMPKLAMAPDGRPKAADSLVSSWAVFKVSSLKVVDMICKHVSLVLWACDLRFWEELL